jgi:hypothetical protein
MSEHRQAIDALRAQFEQWEAALARLGEPRILAPTLPDGQSVKAIVGHLHAWQQLSVARLEAAQADTAPHMPAWLEGGDPEEDAATDRYNARIAALFRDRPWPEVHAAWREGFLRLLALAEALPVATLLDSARFPWLNGYAPLAVLQGSHEHHVEHLDELLAWEAAQA